VIGDTLNKATCPYAIIKLEPVNPKSAQINHMYSITNHITLLAVNGDLGPYYLKDQAHNSTLARRGSLFWEEYE
jgi:hypothetical protein